MALIEVFACRRMWICLWFGSSRRRVAVASGLVTGGYLALLLFSQIYLFLAHDEQENKGLVAKRVRKMTQVEYTLPSLEDVISSVSDPDLQLVLTSFKSQHEQILKETPQARVVIASTWRSGSTLLGEIISSYPGAFYHYEPLMPYGMRQISRNDPQRKILNLISGLLSCNYTDKIGYLHYAYGNPEMFVRNSHLWNICSTMSRSKCYLPDNIGKLCSLFPLQVMKLVRVRLSLLSTLLEGNTKIIWLIRDPRAVISSRLSSVTWCTTPSCKKPKNLCSDLRDDFNTYSRLNSVYPDKIMILRYEDLAKDSYSKIKSVLEFLGLFAHTEVINYLRKHFTGEFEAPWSTIHDPKHQAKKWMKIASWNTIVETQYHCRTVMKLLGYRPFNTPAERMAGNAVQILNIS